MAPCPPPRVASAWGLGPRALGFAAGGGGGGGRPPPGGPPGGAWAAVERPHAVAHAVSAGAAVVRCGAAAVGRLAAVGLGPRAAGLRAAVQRERGAAAVGDLGLPGAADAGRALVLAVRCRAGSSIA